MKMLRTRIPASVMLAAVSVLGSILVCGCSDPDPRIAPGEVEGIWKLDSKNLRSEEFSVNDFDGFFIVLNPDRSFVAEGTPPGLFFNGSKEKSDFKGRWALRYDGHNYIDFITTDLPGTIKDFYGTTFAWKDGRDVIRLGGKGFVYIVRDETPAAPNLQK